MKRVGGGVVLLCFYVRCVFFFFFSRVCVLGTAHLQAVSLAGKTKKTVQLL